MVATFIPNEAGREGSGVRMVRVMFGTRCPLRHRVAFSWLIRAWRLIRCTIVHRINRQALFHQDLFASCCLNDALVHQAPLPSRLGPGGRTREAAGGRGARGGRTDGRKEGRKEGAEGKEGRKGGREEGRTDGKGKRPAERTGTKGSGRGGPRGLLRVRALLSLGRRRPGMRA